MEERTFTLARWHVRPGQEEAFIRLWREELGGHFLGLPRPPLWGTLVQSAEDPSVFYSFGPWSSGEDVQAMRADPRTAEVMGKLRAACIEATPGTYREVLTLTHD